MMRQEFRLPDLGEGIHEAEIVDVCVAAGDSVREDDIILLVETDKATVEVPSPCTGVVAKIHVEQDDVVQVGDVLMTFTTETAGKTGRRGNGAPEAAEPRAYVQAEVATELTRPTAWSKANHRRVPASPATRRLALELDVELQEVPGSGPGGRVTAEDVRAFAGQDRQETQLAARETDEPWSEEIPAEATEARVGEPKSGRPLVIELPPLPDFSRWGPIESVPLQGLRRATARQMTIAWSQIPHVMQQDLVDITELETFRRRHRTDIEQQGGKLTLTVLVMQAVVAALKQFPRFNASLDLDGGRLILKQYYHIGVAVDTERGLLVPVIRDVDRKSMAELAVELSECVKRLRRGRATRDDLQGGTFTITNAGAIGGTAFTPIIHYPEVAILGLARARLEPVVQGDIDQYTIVPRLYLPLHLTFDHRVNDGADAARFMRTLIDLLHDPESFILSV
jgi:pyruvate dehydrogenase E2 component (dihydrolipoamide acetyltransferase)